jgi:plasmid stabilization system protein ParE
MATKVRISRQASEHITSIADYIARDAPEASRRWRKALLADIDSLHRFPLRHGLAPEAEAAGVPVRQMMHGLYRVLYTVDGDVVNVHIVRHGARQLLRTEELPRNA